MLGFVLSLRPWLAAAALLLAGAAPAAHAQVAPATLRESAVKAAFLFNFGSFVEWPAGTFGTAREPLVIGVLGEDAVAEELEHLIQDRSIEGRSVKVRRLKDSDTGGAVHILFAGTQRPARLRELLHGVPGPVLVVTQQEGALRYGSVINFVAEGSRVRFTASLASAEARGLRLSARLLEVAQSVEGRQR
ncbi:MAG: YfiR family protein [Ramlibacter sp.]|nr:YfiR family protein [Ramlibacter sp.]